MIEIYTPTGLGVSSLSSTIYTMEVLSSVDQGDGTFALQYVSAFTFGRSRSVIAAYGTTGAETPRTKLWVSGSSPQLSFITVGCDSQTLFRVGKIGQSISSIELKPKSKNYSATILDGKAIISLNPKDKVWATINNEVSSPLFIFCDPLKSAIPSSNCLYFGPGIHYVSSLAPTATGGHVSRVYATTSVGVSATLRGINFSSFEHYGYVDGQPFTVYLDGGAYVIGTFDIRNRKNITFDGPGYLSVQHVTKETLMSLSAANSSYTSRRDIGVIPIFGSNEFDQHVETFNFPAPLGTLTLPSKNKLPTGITIKNITIVDTPWFSTNGGNNFDNVKILNPWVYSTDGLKPFPDWKTKNCYAIDSFSFVGDDAFLATYNDPGSKSYENYLYSFSSTPGFSQVSSLISRSGGSTIASGCSIYSVNNGPLVVSYFPHFYYNDPNEAETNWALPITIKDFDIGSYSVNRPGETCLRIITDGSSVNRTTSASLWALAPSVSINSIGLRNISLEDIRVEDPIDTELFWIGNMPDPFADGDILLGDRGNEFGFIKGLTLKNITVSGTNDRIYKNRIWGRDASSRPYDITLEDININGIFVTNSNKDYFISWASGSNPTFTNPLTYNSNIVFLFSNDIEEGFVTNKGVRVDYQWDRGQLHPFVATVHYIQEQAKILQASAYYDDNLEEYSRDNLWKNNLQSYANSSTLVSAFPTSFDNYTKYKFGRDFQKLYYDYTHNFLRHRAIPTTTLLDGPTIFGHTFGSVLYNSKLTENGSLTQSRPEFITSSLSATQELNAYSTLFSTSGSASGCYIASTISDVLTYNESGSLISEFRNSGILSHIEFIHTSAASVNNSFAIVRLDKSNRASYGYNPLIYENTLIKQKSTNSISRFAFDLRKYSLNSNLGYDVSTNFLTPDHKFKFSLKASVASTDGKRLGGESVSVWIHTKPENGKIWTFTKDGVWVQNNLSDVKSSTLVSNFCHTLNLPELERNLTNVACTNFLISDNTNRENDVIASLTSSEFYTLDIEFNTENRNIDIPVDYSNNISPSLHRLNQNYVIEVFSNNKNDNKFTMFYDINLVDLTLNKWSKPFVTGKSNGSPFDNYCKEYRVDLNRDQLLTILKYFNEITGAYNPFGYASRVASYTSGVYEASGGSRINYVESPEWSTNTKSSGGSFIRTITLNN